jgi:hypothetical protein
MEGPSFLEEPLLGTIDSQLSGALADIDGVSNEDLDSITRQKLILDAVQELGVEEHVTTQYYLHGDVAVKGKESNRSGNSTLQLPQELDSEIPSAEQIYSHFTEDRVEYVKEALETDTFDWLENYYKQQSEFHFGDVYLSGLPIYSTLHTLKSAAMEQNPNLVPTDMERIVSDHSRELKRSLARYPIFQDIPPYVTEFETAVSPALEWIESQMWEPNDLAKFYDLFDYLYKLFYEGVWKAVGQQMSYNTVKGPSVQDTVDRRVQEMKSQKLEFEVKIDRLQMASDTAGVDIIADVERLPDIEPVDVGPTPSIPEEELAEVPEDDPAFSLLD